MDSMEFENFGREAVFTGNLNIKDTKNFVKVKDRFMQEVLTTWDEVNFEDRITSVNHFLGQSLWNNSLIRIGNCPVSYPDWKSKGIVKVKHLKDDHNNFLSPLMLQNRYKIKIRPLEYCGLLSAVNHLWKSYKHNLVVNNFGNGIDFG